MVLIPRVGAKQRENPMKIKDDTVDLANTTAVTEFAQISKSTWTRPDIIINHGRAGRSSCVGEPRPIGREKCWIHHTSLPPTLGMHSYLLASCAVLSSGRTADYQYGIRSTSVSGNRLATRGRYSFFSRDFRFFLHC